MCAQAKQPFGSVSATKSFGKTLTFYRRGNRQKVKSYGVPTGDPSEAQLSQQAYIRSKVAAWQALSAPEKAEWNTRAKARGNPWYGYTLFMATMEAVMNFIELLDTFSSYVGKGGMVLQVKITEDGIEAVAQVLAELMIAETFDDLDTAAIDGQGDYPRMTAWTGTEVGTGVAEVQVKSGDDKMLRFTTGDPFASNYGAVEISCNSDSYMTKGIVKWKFRSSDTALSVDMRFHEGTPAKFIVGTYNDQLRFRYASASWTNFCAIADNTWYEIEVHFDSACQRVTVFVDGVWKGFFLIDDDSKFKYIDRFYARPWNNSLNVDIDDFEIVCGLAYPSSI